MEESLWDQVMDAQPGQSEEPVWESISLETENLIYRGHLTDSIQIGNHTIVVRTLRIGEELEAVLLAKKYQETAEAGRAIATALAAASIVSVDGQPLVENLGPGDPPLAQKYEYLLRNWYWDTISRIYKAYADLVERVTDSLDEVKKD